MLLNCEAAPLPTCCSCCCRIPIQLVLQYLWAAPAWLSLVQEYPGHVVGRLGKAVLKLYNKEYAAAVAVVAPMPRQLGTLGLFRGVAAVAESLRKLDARVEKVPYTSIPFCEELSEHL